MDKGFQFVDGTRNDRKTKRIIRSHAMKGINAGRKLHRSSRLDLDRQRLCRSLVTARVSSSLSPIVREPPLAVTTPFVFTVGMRQVVNQFFNNVADRLYPRHRIVDFDDAKALWLHVLLADEAACHCAISTMAACNEFLNNDTTTATSLLTSSNSSSSSSVVARSSLGLYHLSQALALISKRIASREALSDASFGIIIMLIIQEQIRHGHETTRVHFEGLCRMVALRGGLDQLEPNKLLLLEIYKMDISYTLQYSHPPVFTWDNTTSLKELFASKMAATAFVSDTGSTIEFHSVAASAAASRASRPMRTLRIDPRLADVVDDIENFTALLNSGSDASGPILDSISFLKITISILSRLVHFCPPVANNSVTSYIDGTCTHHREDATSSLDDACHAGLVLFMITVCLQSDTRRVVEYDPASKRLQNILFSNGCGNGNGHGSGNSSGTSCENGMCELDDHIVLWLLFIGGIWAIGGRDANGVQSRYTVRIRLLADKLGLLSWEAARAAVGVYPWVQAVHDEKGHDLWRMAHSLALSSEQPCP